MIGSPNYILNEVPGSWQTCRGLVIANWFPVMNSAYPTSSALTCTMTVEHPTTTFTTTNSARIVTCDDADYPQACGHYSSVVANNSCNSILVCHYDLYPSDKDSSAVTTWHDSPVLGFYGYQTYLPGFITTVPGMSIRQNTSLTQHRPTITSGSDLCRMVKTPALVSFGEVPVEIHPRALLSKDAALPV